MVSDSITYRMKRAWNAFRSRSPTEPYQNYGHSSGMRPDRPLLSLGVDRSMLTPIYTRIGIDVASVKTQHVRVDQNGRYKENIDSKLNECLTLDANIDQVGRHFMQDIVMTLIDDGVAAIVPVDTTINPNVSDGYDITSMRVGRVTEWFPRHVRVSVYNDQVGRREELLLSKTMVAIVENPLYAVMNEPSSTLKRLIHKLNILDGIDEQSGSGKLDIIIQLPYVIKSEARRKEAEKRRKDIEMQLSGSKYGIAYADGSERITQLNRPAENNLLAQITYLTSMLYSQLGMSEAVFNGTAEEKEMLNYYNRTVEPILSSITDSMTRTFLTKTARTQGQRIMYFRDPFKLVPVHEVADMADKFTRNEILSSNEFRGIVGYKPVDHPSADELSNKNLNKGEGDDKAVVDNDEKDTKEDKT